MQTYTVKSRLVARPAVSVASEWRFVAGIIAVVLLLTSLPYLYAYVSAPDDKQFMGIMLDVPDHGQYFSWMRELAHAPLASNKLTPEPNRAIFFNLLWWGLGRLGRLLDVGYAGMYQVLRLSSAALFLLAVYRVISWFLPERVQRRLAFLLAVFSSGFGWILVVMKYTVTGGELLFPLDVYIAEGNTFLGILGYPHFIAAALYILVFDLVWRGEARGQLRYALAAGGLALFLGWQHAYDLILVYGILGGTALFTWLRDRRLPRYQVASLVIIGLISVWPALYSLILTEADPLWEQVLAQYVNAGVFTPNLLHLPVLMGPAFLVALYSVWRARSFRLQWVPDKDLYLRSWFLWNFLLIYIPTDYQIHLLNGWQVPIAILATQGIYRYITPAVDRFATRRKSRWAGRLRSPQVLGMLLVLLVLPTNLYLWSWRFIDLARHDYPYFLHKDDLAAMHWLEVNAAPDDVVLSSLTTGQYLPAETGTYAFLAHWAQTLDFFAKRDLVAAFFSIDTSSQERLAMLRNYHVDYIFYGPAERALGDFHLDSAAYLEQVFVAPNAAVYAVRLPD